MKLLKAQKNHLYDAIVGTGVDPDKFNFEESSYDVSVRHANSDYKFTLEENAYEKEYILKFRPSKNRYYDIIATKEWEAVVTAFKAWLSFIKREQATPDKWG